jgi:CRP-like cAMP-binding protein
MILSRVLETLEPLVPLSVGNKSVKGQPFWTIPKTPCYSIVMANPMISRLFHFLSRFIDLTEEEARALAELDLIREYKKGEYLLRAGETTSTSYFVLQGLVRSYSLIDGEERITQFYQEYDPIAPPCTITGEPSDQYLDCLETSILVVSTEEQAEENLEKYPSFERLCRVLSDMWMAEERTSFNKFKSLTPEQRYVDLVEHRPGLLQRVPQYQLASFLGIKPESLSRIRKRISQRKTPGRSAM